ncbi:hypothetical protein C9374_005861 [Naegleria lovaniensis]|uniref:F-box domain-containing protein n=1 Tax=Naegleria lovaniensis TaxID=51637 RepID=A0AA88KHR1_NAELO|nr:uncharacterized protein C9374_005861 [Naegleria lovaniensis]KAG2382069.1 hypothetical protein C9374_005861 [Naegleria lovaniensis]
MASLQQRPSSSLLQLPPEIITQIFYYVQEAPDVYRLALSSKLLFSIFQYEMSYHLDSIRLEYLNNPSLRNNTNQTSCTSTPFRATRQNRLIELFSRNDPSCPSEKVMMSYDHYFEKRNLMYKKAYMDKLPDLPDTIEDKERLTSDMLDVPLAITPFEHEEDHHEDDEEHNDEDEEDERPFLKSRKKPNMDNLYNMTLRSFQNRMQKILLKNPLARIALQCLFDFNQSHATSNKTRFIVAGGFILHVLTDCGSCDIDIFCINNGENEVTVDNALKGVLIEMEKRFRKEKIDYRLLKTNGTLNLLPKTNGNRDMNHRYPDARAKESKLAVQFVLRKVQTIEELMCFFDIDCCRFCYDGQQVFTILEGLRALRHRLNFVSREHIQSGMYMDRAVKYFRRGFGTLCVDFKHPLQHNLHIQPFINWLRNFVIENFNEDEEPNYDHELMADEMWNGFGTLAPYMFFFHNFTDIRDLDEVNYYAVVLKSLDYWLVECVLQNGLKNSLDYFLENGDYSDGRWTANFKHIQVTPLNYQDAVVDGIIRHIQEEDVHYFCRNIPDLFSKHCALFITEGYLDSHLAQKYHFYKCYLCGKYSHNGDNVHFCRDCHKFNEENKLQIMNKTHLQGKVAIVTGGRIKIGYETSKMLLEKGATTIVTTRFPHNALKKFQAETNYSKWKDNLIIYPLNLKDGKSILNFTEFVKSKFSRIDIIINNAAQTVRRPVTYYKPLVEIEKQHVDQPLPLSTATTDKKNDSTSTVTELQQLTTNLVNDTLRITLEERLPEDIEYKPMMQDKDKWGEPEDTRTLNSWNLKLPEISNVEILECQMINNIAPTILISQLTDVLKPKFTNDTDFDFNDPLTMYSFIINVTSHEGQFSATGKTDCHIHTNMSKASLNMLTRSGANYYAKMGILMNSVDTGWVSSAVATFKEPPLTTQDAACRILHPILSGTFEYGKLFKDYRVVDW